MSVHSGIIEVLNFKFHKQTLAVFGWVICTVSLCGCADRPVDPVNIEFPGPDLANFPNSAYTLPQGRTYIEFAPAVYNAKTPQSGQQYNVSYIVRYGFTDALELRLLSSGFTVQDGPDKTRSGFAPQVFDIKWHVFDAVPELFLPAFGIEASVQSTWASKYFRNGTYPALSLNFDQNLPYRISAEYNVGFAGTQDANGYDVYQLALAWALQRNVAKGVAVFVNGYVTAASGLPTSAIGGGAQWTINERIALFANIDAGLTVNTPPLYTLLGMAVAF